MKCSATSFLKTIIIICHNSHIHDKCQTQSAKVLTPAIITGSLRQFEWDPATVKHTKLQVGIPLLWIRDKPESALSEWRYFVLLGIVYLCSPTYVLLEAYYVLLEVYCVLLKTSIFPKFVMFSSKFIVFSSKFIMFYSNVCSDSGEHFTTSKICKSICVLLKRTLCNYPKSASLLVFYSGEHFTTLWNWQVYLCSTQENTLRLSNICESICVILRRTLYNYPKLTCLHVFYSGEHSTTTQYLQVCLCSHSGEHFTTIQYLRVY
jgi:hypothetical protein